MHSILVREGTFHILNYYRKEMNTRAVYVFEGMLIFFLSKPGIHDSHYSP